MSNDYFIFCLHGVLMMQNCLITWRVGTVCGIHSLVVSVKAVHNLSLIHTK
jgi:hypothetical protein